RSWPLSSYAIRHDAGRSRSNASTDPPYSFSPPQLVRRRGARVSEDLRSSSVGDAEAPADVPRALQFVEDRDGVVLESDEAPARRVAQELVAGGTVAAGALARPDLGGRAEK